MSGVTGSPCCGTPGTWDILGVETPSLLIALPAALC